MPERFPVLPRILPSAALVFRGALFCALLSLLSALGLPFSLERLEARERPLRIISLYAAHTEIVLRLGSRDALVGISHQETYDGPETEGWKRPPAFSAQDDIEKYLAARPDIILVRPQHLSSAPGLFQSLENFGVKIWARQIIHAEDLYGYWLELGKICGKDPEAWKMVDDFKAKLAPHEARTASRSQKPGVFFESIYKEVKTFTPDSIPIWVLTVSGGRNVAADASPTRPGLIVAAYGPERLLDKAAEIDVLLSQEGPMNRVPLEVVTARDIYKVLPAVKNGRVYKVPEVLVSRPTPSILEGVELMERLLYPGDPVGEAAGPIPDASGAALSAPAK
ncbi:MAG: ABC transporter substrate-binding protein [Deltaproteobacteria bacterium]|jgi:iron complex transport system substrate-binding protein|nr:ABC transporter substrate-binding protein [Deltaproteobacteria bacterium]